MNSLNIFRMYGTVKYVIASLAVDLVSFVFWGYFFCISLFSLFLVVHCLNAVILKYLSNICKCDWVVLFTFWMVIFYIPEATVEVLPRLFKIKYESGTLEELLYVDMPREYHNSSGQIVLDYAKAIQESVFEQLRVYKETFVWTIGVCWEKQKNLWT